MSFEPRDYLRHILVEADYLLAQSADLSFEEFVANETLRRAFVRSLEIIGQAAKNIPDDFRARYSMSGCTLSDGTGVRIIEGRAVAKQRGVPVASRLRGGRSRR